jgi:hypothetical protein
MCCGTVLKSSTPLPASEKHGFLHSDTLVETDEPSCSVYKNAVQNNTPDYHLITITSVSIDNFEKCDVPRNVSIF